MYFAINKFNYKKYQIKIVWNNFVLNNTIYNNLDELMISI